MLVVPTGKFGNPMVLFVLKVAGYGLLHGVYGFGRSCCILFHYWYNLVCLKKKNHLHGLAAVTKT
jgi:hypothetical protein